MAEVKYTHRLECSHCVSSRQRMRYTMRCNILGYTKKSIKLEIIGERNWKGFDQKKRIRYLPKDESWRLYEVEKK